MAKKKGGETTKKPLYLPHLPPIEYTRVVESTALLYREMYVDANIRELGLARVMFHEALARARLPKRDILWGMEEDQLPGDFVSPPIESGDDD
jgi:hypothetical protein